MNTESMDSYIFQQIQKVTHNLNIISIAIRNSTLQLVIASHPRTQIPFSQKFTFDFPKSNSHVYGW